MSKTPEELAEEFVNQEDTGSDTFAHGLRIGFLAGYQAAAPQWISVKDRLPEFGNLVLVFGVMEGALVPSVCIGMLSDNAENNYYDNTQPMKLWEAWERIGYDQMLLNNPKGITHWMPLPKPPEE